MSSSISIFFICSMAVVALLGQRFAYVKAASKFKTSEATVRVSERLQAMLQQRRVWAAEEGLDADAIEKMGLLIRGINFYFRAARCAARK